jgi:hypothetical protein
VTDGVYAIPPARDLPSGRLLQLREHLVAEIVRARDSERSPASVRLRGSRRRKIAVLALAALVVVVATASALAVRAFVLHQGFIGLPPQGATPSTPESGELVLHYFGPNPGVHGKSRIWVYTDGRLISLRDADYPEGANSASTGFLEQRLTPEGVELLRSEVISTGLLAHEPAPGGEALPGETEPGYIEIEVRDGDRLVPVERARDVERLVARITDPASWLPASAWQDREIRAYVPSTFAVCYGAWPPAQPIERSRILSLLPAAAGDLLRGRDSMLREGRFVLAGQDLGAVVEYCSDVTIEEARALAQTLDHERLEPFMPASRLSYRFEVPGSNGDMVQIYFEPYLPHGEFACSACG